MTPPEYLQGPPSIPAQFSGDWYQVDGGPNLQIEALRSTAQDVYVRIVIQNSSAMNLKREVAYAGSLWEGQVSQVLAYPVEVYENTAPGNYTLYAIANYTYQRDVAVKPHSDSPENPDIFCWYSTASQTIPLVARLRPETGIYVDMDESPIALLRPGEKAELVYKVEVSKDAIAGKSYRFTLLFDYSDTYRKGLQDR